MNFRAPPLKGGREIIIWDVVGPMLSLRRKYGSEGR